MNAESAKDSLRYAFHRTRPEKLFVTKEFEAPLRREMKRRSVMYGDYVDPGEDITFRGVPISFYGTLDAASDAARADVYRVAGMLTKSRRVLVVGPHESMKVVI